MRHSSQGRSITVALIGGAVLAGLGVVMVAASRGIQAPRARRVLPDDGLLPEFSLMDERARPVTRQTLDGSVWIADLIFTRCAGQCPLMSAQMATLERRLADAAGLRLISISVDPAHDTPAALARYAARYRTQPDRWWFLTGAPEAIATVARQGFHLGVSQDGTVQEPITHSVRLVLVDQRGHLRGSYDAMEAEAMARLLEDARRLLTEPPA
ncbi:MAG: SCO family protein [Candidatus Omnitrophica bacterium]|nr:SCO family protein [Candidatus Omnitrophota bacterium]